MVCTFIRLTGCNLRCSYCDTTYAYYQGEEMTPEEVLRRVEDFAASLVMITGGEPLLSPELNQLVNSLTRHNYQIMVETNGSLDIGKIEGEVVRIVDIKCPGSGMSEHIYWDNLNQLTPNDQVKFVIGDREDYQWAKGVMARHKLAEKLPVLFSPVFGKMAPRLLAGWIVEDNLKVRFQLQLHKYIWGPDRRGV
ncbi:7-carboxy-7-deazaguanine synthase [bacterium (candidate division B38) B3_B38]|nr:MAG: 7-carboxy-7-deazaguanine synthase [bacterium (candidate division B38) B3_B38]